MFKKHMTPIGIHRKGSLNNSPGKEATPPAPAMAAARGGGSNTMNDYAKATPMANPQAPDDGSGGDPFGLG